MFTFSLLTLTQEAPMRRSRSRSPSLALALLLISALALTLLSGCQANRDQRDVVQPYEPRALKASLKALATQAHTLQALKGDRLVVWLLKPLIEPHEVWVTEPRLNTRALPKASL